MLQENLVARFADSFRHHWHTPAFTDHEGPTITYGEAAHRIFRLHRLFDLVGLERGDKVALIGRNRTNWAVTYLAAVSHGAVIVPILPDFTGEEIQHIVTHSDARLVFLSDSIFDKVDESKLTKAEAVLSLTDFSLRHARYPEAGKAAARAEKDYREAYAEKLTPDGLRFAEVPGDALAAVVYTSGTTGFSKGVMLTGDSLMANARFFIDNLDIPPGQTVVSFLPLAHAFGCAFEFIAPVVAGNHITFIEKMPTPKVLMKAFAEVKPRIILSVPLIIEKIYRNRIRPKLEGGTMKLLLKTPLIANVVRKKIRDQVSEVFGGNFQEIVVGGAALNVEVEQFFRGIGFPLACGYGMTECAPLISYTVVADDPPPGSVGKIIPYLECRIDETDPEHGIGEILVRGLNVMQGYYKDEESTRSAIDEDGWLHTGDLGRMDDEGYLYLTGRSKNMILTPSGQNIYPEEIESRLNNLPYIAESLVLEKDGKICALVHPDIEAADADGLDEKAITAIMEENRQALNAQVPAYANISKLRALFEEFEMTPTKKIKRRLYSFLD